MLLRMGYTYSSSSARWFVDELMDFIKRESYLASIDLAIEKGPFPAYQEEFLASGYIQRAIPDYIQDKIQEHGIRNCALLTIAPTGTTAMVANVSTGIEPIFAAAYYRRFYRPTPDGSRALDKELVMNPLWWEFEGADKLDLLEGAYDIEPEDHFEMQKVCQNHIDNATSKTINLPNNYRVDSLSDLWLEYLPHLKGTTFYRAGSRGEEPLEAIPLQTAKRIVYTEDMNKVGDATITDQNSMDCPDGVCEIPEHLKPKITERERVIEFV
jgi:ribonucleoside-diphosphate reductase alpha chain